MKKLGRGLAVITAACTVTSCLCACGRKRPAETGGKPEIVVDYTVESKVPDFIGNDERYAVKNIEKKADSPLAGKTIYWLGSSVTYGSAAYGESMADFLAATTGCVSKKEAVSGTTIYDDGGNGDSGVRSYTRRMVNSTVFDKTEHVDAFVCQISTNDARNDRLDKWGQITPGEFGSDKFDRKTTLGGAEFIIAYVVETWNCPVYFYSGAYFGDSGLRSGTNPTGTNYGKLVDEIKKIAEKWSNDGYDVKVIDMYNDEKFNAVVNDEYYGWCMSDAIHPRRAGYLQWWTPYIESRLVADLAKK